MKLAIKLVALSALLTSLVVVPAPAQAAKPSNDDFAHPTVMPSFPSTKTGSTVKATRAADDPECGSDASIWFSYKPTKNRTIVVTTAGSSFPTSLGVYVGTRGALTQLVCGNSEGGSQTGAQIDVLRGTRYYFMVSSDLGSTARGSVKLSLQKPPTMSLTLSKLGTVDQNGIVTLQGTYACEAPGVIFFNATGQQGESFSRLSENFLSCPATRTPFEYGFRTSLGPPLHAGSMRLGWDAHLRADNGGQADDNGTKTVCLRFLEAPE